MKLDLITPDKTRIGDITIRPFALGDGDAFLEAVQESIEPLCRWMTWCKPDYTSADAQGFLCQSALDWKLDKNYSFAIVDSEHPTILGSVGLNQINRAHNCANMGYWVRSKHTRSGVASYAVRFAAAYGVKKLRFNRLELVIPTNNPASIRVAQKAGAKHEGVLRSRLVLNGKIHNAAVYSFTAPDFDTVHFPELAAIE